MNNFPCLVVRGISDYADSHRNDVWRAYAAAMTAMYAKEHLYVLAPRMVEAMPKVAELFEGVCACYEKANNVISYLKLNGFCLATVNG
jgi:hypothetical protein